MREKDDSLVRNKLIRDKMNASFDVETSHENTLYFNNRQTNGDNIITMGNQQVFTTEESDDFSRENPSGEKKRIRMTKGNIFETRNDQTERGKKVKDSWFFKVLNELFSPNQQ